MPEVQERLLGSAQKRAGVPKKVKVRAQQQLRDAVRKGLVKKPNECERCGILAHPVYPLQGHHEDYSKPLEVEWLCPRCHSKEHGLEKRGPDFAKRHKEKSESVQNYYGAYICRLREAKGKSLRETARALTLSPQYLSDVELGNQGPLKTPQAALLVDYLDLNVLEALPLSGLAKLSRLERAIRKVGE